MKHLISKIFIIGLGACSIACSSDVETGNNSEPITIELNAEQTQVAENFNIFSLSLLKDIHRVQENKGEETNIIFSPVSLSTALAVLANGAHGETLEEITATVGVGNLESMNSLFAKVIPALGKADNKVRLALANSVVVDKELNIRSQFIEDVGKTFGVDFFHIDFGSPTWTKDINQWAQNKTFGMITDVVDKELTGPAIFVNTTYFKAPWSEPFNPELTKPGNFYDEEGNVKTWTSYMNKKDHNLFYEGDKWSATEVSYGNRSFSMLFILPNEGSSVSEVLRCEDFTALVGGKLFPEAILIDLYLPKFTIASNFSYLATLLKERGIQRLFSENAELDKFTSDKVNFNFVTQKNKIIVNEEGSEMASATVIGALTSPGSGDKFKLNRPFIFIVKERSSNVILFEGVVSNPEK